MNSFSRPTATLGCLVGLFGMLLAFGIEVARFIGTVRLPYEIPLGALVEAQIEALGPEWRFDQDVSYFTTDTDSTSGAWMFFIRYNHTNWRYHLLQEIHTFRSPDRIRRPSIWVRFGHWIDEDAVQPAGWTYRPPHADRFVLDCTSEPLPVSCEVLLVYEEYGIELETDVAGAMTLEDLQRVLKATDAFMADYLSATELQRGRRQIPTPADLGLPESE